VDESPKSRLEEYRQLMHALEMTDMERSTSSFKKDPEWLQEMTLGQLRAMKAAREAARLHEEAGGQESKE